MVLEILINPKKAERKPWEMFFIGLLYSSIAIFLGMWIFEKYVSLVMVFLTVLGCTHLIQGTLKMEEEKDTRIGAEVMLLKEHGKALSFFMFLFLGFVVSFSFWYIMLPSDAINQIFSSQIDTIRAISNMTVSGSFSSQSRLFSQIFFNNMKVLFFCILFAFFYGAGAVFILAWNASVIGTAIGNLVRNAISVIASEAGLVSIGNYFATYSLGLMRYFIHGLPEILAYFTAALGAGIISIAAVRHNFGSGQFKHIVSDSFDLVAISIVILFIAALLEVFITPLLF